MALTKEQWKASYAHRFDKREYKPKIDIFGNKKQPRNAKRRKPIKTPDWLLKGGIPPKNIKYDDRTEKYSRIPKVYKPRKKRLARAKRPSNNES